MVRKTSTRARSAITGRFITRKQAARNPNTTILERIRKRKR